MLVNADTFTVSSPKRLGLVYLIFSTVVFAVSLGKSREQLFCYLILLHCHLIIDLTKTNNIVHDQLQSQGFKRCHKDIYMINQGQFLTFLLE